MRTHLLFLSIFFVLLSCNTSKKTQVTLSPAEQTLAIRQVLNAGVNRGVAILSKKDGFNNNKMYRIGLPPSAQNMEATFRQMGMQPMTDRTILAMNLSAEDAIGYVGSIFSDAINKMEISDPQSIIAGSDSAASVYFKIHEQEKLLISVTPIVKSSMDKFSVPKYYNDMLSNYKGFSENIKLNNITTYITQSIISALIDEMEQHEVAVRHNRSYRNSMLLKRAFN